MIRMSRDWATPLTIGAFGLMAVTGGLLFFHLDTGLGKAAHEWLGWALIAAVVAHAAANGGSLRRHLTASRRAQAIVAAFALVLAASLVLPAPAGDAPSPPVLAMRAVAQAPLHQVAILAGKPVDALRDTLAAAGLPAADDGVTLQALTGGDRARLGQAMRVVFSASPAPADTGGR